MSEIYINYGNLEDSVERSKKVRRHMADYVSDIKREITTPINKLSGSDSAGYASTAASLALQKINDLNEKSANFSSFESKVTSLVSTAKAKDNYVSSQIESISSMYIEKRNWFQNAGDWIYNTFCDISNKWDLVRDFVDAASWISNKIGNFYEAVVDWFKYGDGKYVANIISAVVGSIVAFGGLVVACVGLVAATPLAAIIGVIGAVAALVGTVITIANACVSIKQNVKALSKSGNIFDDGDGDPSAARYYGSQNSLSEYYNKNDMGDKETNEFYEAYGEGVDKAKKIADITSFVCSIAKLGVVRDYTINNGPNDVGYSFTYDNIKKNVLHSMGYNSKEVLNKKEAFNFNENLFSKDIKADKFAPKKDLNINLFGKKFNLGKAGESVASDTFIKVYKSTKVFDNINDFNKNSVTISDHFSYGNNNITWESTGEVVEAVVDIFGNMDFYSPFGDYGKDGGKFFSNIFEVFVG